MKKLHMLRHAIAVLSLALAGLSAGGCGPGLVIAGGGALGVIAGTDSGGGSGGSGGTVGNLPAVVVLSGLTREESPANIEFVIVDANSDPVDIEVEYSTDGGSVFSPCTPAAGVPTTGLATSPAGTAHTFGWNFSQDIGFGHRSGLRIRIRAHDGTVQGDWGMMSGLVIGNDAPEIPPASITVDDSTSIVLFQFDLVDAGSDAADISVRYSTDQAQSWFDVPAADFFGNPPQGLPTAPGTGLPAQFTWQTERTLPGYVGEVWVQLQTSDQPPGYSQSTPGGIVQVQGVQIDNRINQPPELALNTEFEGATFVSRVSAAVTLLDADSDPGVVQVEYTLDGEIFAPATMVGQFAQGMVGPFALGPNPAPFTLTWNALADIAGILPYQNQYNGVRLRLTPADSQAGEPVITPAFSIIGNTAPEVADVEPFQNSGNITFIVRVKDDSSDPVTATVRYSTDGSTWADVPLGHWVQGTPAQLESGPFGRANFLTWNSAATLGSNNFPAVRLAFTPTDVPPSAPQTGLEGPEFVSAPFSVVNNLSDTNPASVSVYTSDSGGTPTSPQQVTVQPGGSDVYLGRDISPPGAMIVHDTFWSIDGPGGTLGTLLTPAGGPLPRATGQFTLGSSVQDGHSVTLHDGINPPHTFAFRTDPGSPLEPGPNLTVVDAVGVSGAENLADALASAINGAAQVRLLADSVGGGVVELMHQYASAVGNATSEDAARGNAQDFSASPPSLISNVQQMAGGDSVERVRYRPPPTAPGGSDSVVIRATIDNAQFLHVSGTRRLYWGSPVTGVQVSPTPTDVMLGSSKQFTATVLPASTAPQHVTWSVVEGSSHGSITSSGLYTAPSSMPSSSTVRVRATSVDPAAPVGEATITLRPQPSAVTIQPSNPPELELDDDRVFMATVQPSGADQGVAWEIWHDGQNRGTGPGPFGALVDLGGGQARYEAPSSLVSPPAVQIRATSTAASSIFGTVTQELKAPPPTDFKVGPANEVVFAGGAGLQFFVFDFVPANANTGVSWTLDPDQQHGTIDPATGKYTPPKDFSGPPATVRAVARSSADTSVVRSVDFTLNPPQLHPPTHIEGLPLVARTHSSGPGIEFRPEVQPRTASQDVTWTFVGSPFGQFSGNTYVPAATSTDRVITVRCTADGSSVFFDVEIRIAAGTGDWDGEAQLVRERSNHSAVWDDMNSRLWILGGNSPVSGDSTHDVEVLYQTVGSTPTMHRAAFTLANRSQSNAPNTSTTVLDTTGSRLVSILGNGSSIASVAILPLSPSIGTTWLYPLTMNNANAPVLDATSRYHAWYDASTNNLRVLASTRFMHSLNMSTFEWLPVVSLNSPGAGPTQVNDTSMVQVGTREYVFVGSEPALGIGLATGVYRLSLNTGTWQRYTNAGNPPSNTVLARPGLVARTSSQVHLFGGQRSGSTDASSTRYNITLDSILGVLTATWQIVSTPAGDSPRARSHTTITEIGSGQAIMYGGATPIGSMGDSWRLNISTNAFTPLSGGNLRPEGRRDAAAAWLNGRGYVFGGEAAFGLCNELWSFEYTGTVVEWQRHGVTATGPSPRSGAAMVADTVNNRLLMFGGRTSLATETYSSQLWEYLPSTGVWQQLAPGAGSAGVPAARSRAAATFDADGERLFVFGGRNSTGDLGDLWVLELSGGTGNWQRLEGGVGPAGRFGSVMGYDAVTDRVLVLGGASGTSGNRQLFAYSLAAGQWSQLNVGNGGNALNVHNSAAVFDGFMGRFLHAPSGTVRAQAVVMATSGATWQMLPDAPAPTHAIGASGLFDPVNRRYFTFGGSRTISGRQVTGNAWKVLEYQ